MPRTALRSMAMAATIAMIGFGCAASGSAIGASPPEVAVDRFAAGSTVSLRPGQRLAVSLPGNPTTGYLWEVVRGTGEVLAQLGDPQYQATGAAIGGGGVYRFLFQGTSPGSAALKLAYRRPFEAGAPAAETFELTVVVSP